ncbi:phosphate/phosphite/phosphonate ABC transporter substrate-binding protein [Thiomicrorhabdus sp. 6S2-11]|uniref:Phosphate/phosphite/phosphonate ABC transporter substrate-binding protein n=1 Tax=Thiomicrorhabdus marina TaxID=2818442 RepID=A0ABS3Q2M4_9GAMM|nr:phosphate/phosphite/phosphonate ABC transporter substrate-binding protein [Thiomicrorhabdus marina]MBO1926569.1 phosphate/phosphite/phosphonate ABC transporter substrate-binding protein [Thiomicrorhabdus marina]
MTHPLFRKLSSALFLVMLIAGFGQPSRASESVSMALFPYATPAHLIKAHQPLKERFSQTLQAPIHLVSARDFASFSDAIRAGQYDIILGAPHMGRLAELTDQYQWLGFTSNHSYAVIVTHRNHQGKTLKDFKGQQIILPPRSAIVNYLSRQALQQAGIRPDIDIEIIETSSHQSAMLAAISDIYPLAGFGKPVWEDFNPEGKENLLKLFQSKSFPGFALMANKRLGQEKIAKLRKAFLSFAKTDAGKRYFSEQGLHNSRPETPQDMLQLDAFLLELGMLNTEQRARLEQSKP